MYHIVLSYLVMRKPALLQMQSAKVQPYSLISTIIGYDFEKDLKCQGLFSEEI